MTHIDVFKNIRGLAPREVIELLEHILLLFPEELRCRLKNVIDSLPSEGDNLQKVLELVRSQWKGLRSHEWVRIAVVGPARTGKSALLNAILKKQAQPVTPIFSVIDSQGLEEYLGYGAGSSAMKELEEADVLQLVLDGHYGIAESTLELHERLLSLNKPLMVVLNKMDLVENPASVIKVAKKRLNSLIFPTSLSQGAALDKLFKAIVVTYPRALNPLTQNFPEFRKTICSGIVTQSSFSAGLVGAIVIPVSDLLPLVAIQTAMILKIARAFGHKLNRERARELLPMLAGGALVREGSHRLRRRFPEQRGLIAVSVAGLWTFGLGRAAIAYFENLTRFLKGKKPANVEPLFRAEAR